MRETAILVTLALAASGCGYHVGGHTNLLPKTIKTIAIPTFGNATIRQKLPAMLSADIGREFLSRTHYTVVAEPEQADAVLTGALVNFVAYPTVFDPVSNRATAAQVEVTLQITLTDRATGQVLFARPNAVYRDRYEITTDPQAYFDESDTAMIRVSRDVARGVVTGILENF